MRDIELFIFLNRNLAKKIQTLYYIHEEERKQDTAAKVLQPSCPPRVHKPHRSLFMLSVYAIKGIRRWLHSAVSQAQIHLFRCTTWTPPSTTCFKMDLKLVIFNNSKAIFNLMYACCPIIFGCACVCFIFYFFSFALKNVCTWNEFQAWYTR